MRHLNVFFWHSISLSLSRTKSCSVVLGGTWLNQERATASFNGTASFNRRFDREWLFIELTFILNCLEIDEMSKESLEYLFGTLINKKDGSRRFSGKSLLQEREILSGHVAFFPDKISNVPTSMFCWLSQLLLCEIINFARDTHVTHAQCVCHVRVS